MNETTETIPFNTTPPDDKDNPLSPIDNGDLSIPETDTWKPNGTAHNTDENIHEISWSANTPTPGYPDSEYTTLVLEHTTFCPDNPFNTGFTVSLFPFNADKNPINKNRFAQESIAVGTYKRLPLTLKNIENIIERMETMEPGDRIILNEKAYRLPKSETETESETETRQNVRL